MGKELVAGFDAVIRDSTIGITLGVTAAKVFIWNLLPIPGLNGYWLLSTLALWRQKPGKRTETAQLFGLFILLVQMVLWANACVAFWMSP